jgi:hypothetical protein
MMILSGCIVFHARSGLKRNQVCEAFIIELVTHRRPRKRRGVTCLQLFYVQIAMIKHGECCLMVVGFFVGVIVGWLADDLKANVLGVHG